jgi:hypothetical protein
MDEKEKIRFDAQGNKLPEQICPACGYDLDAATYAGKEDLRPRPGDVSICFKCANVLVFDVDMKLREPMSAELLEILQDEGVQNLVERLKTRRQKRNGG